MLCAELEELEAEFVYILPRSRNQTSPSRKEVP